MLTNMYANIVDMAIPFSFKNFFKWLKFREEYKKFYRKIYRGSPAFSALWEFSDFIKFSDVVFVIKDDSLISSTEYRPGENGFKIKEQYRNITVKLYSEQEKVGIDIENMNTSGKRKFNFTFEKGDWTKDHDMYDEFFMDMIIQAINNTILRRLDMCIREKILLIYKIDINKKSNRFIKLD